MEDSLIAFLIIFVSLTGVFTSIYITKFSGNKRKKAIKTVKEENVDSIVQSYANSIEVLKEQNEFLVQENKTIKKRLAAEIGVNLKAEERQFAPKKEIKINSDNLEDEYEIDVSNGLKLVESMNLPFLANMDKSKIPDLINNPMIKGKVWEYIKANQTEMIALGVIVPKGQASQIQTIQKEEKPEEDNGMMGLEFNQSNAKHMA